jgi:hypothetical protein
MGKDDFGIDESIKGEGAKGRYRGKAIDNIHFSRKPKKFFISVSPCSVKKDSG